MIVPTKDEAELIEGFPTIEKILALYEPVARINAFCPHMNANRIAELKNAMLLKEGIPSPMEYARAVAVVRRYEETIKTNRTYGLACRIAAELRLGIDDVPRIERILKCR